MATRTKEATGIMISCSAAEAQRLYEAVPLDVNICLLWLSMQEGEYQAGELHFAFPLSAQMLIILAKIEDVLQVSRVAYS